ncbi:MAG: helix-turn-helix transcriptional regulator [Alcanivorax sediminis]|uniref:helix-turn-helix transcriptional regulator n=1 Tax=Alcanivorax sediminis TaxID=2663008 RepID=UPI003C694EDC
MFIGKGLDSLLDALYHAPYEASGWQEFLNRIVSLSGSRSARILVMNKDADQVFNGVQVNTDASAYQAFVDHYVNLCPWRPGLSTLPPGKFYSSFLDGICDQKTFYRSEFFNDWARHLDIHHGASGTVWQHDGQTIQMFMQRTGGQGHFSRDETNAFNALAPHIRRALRLEAIMHQRKQQQTFLEQQGRFSAMLLVNARGELVYAAEPARVILREEQGIRLHARKLRLRDKAGQENLDRLLSASFDIGNTHAPVTGGVVAVWRLGRTPLLMQVIPLHPDADSNLVPVPAHAAIYLIDGELETEVDLEKLASLLDLTPAEARIASLISQGEKPADIAVSCQVSIHTVRSQIKSIFTKTEVSTQAQLTKLVRALPVQRQVTLPRTPFLLSSAG